MGVGAGLYMYDIVVKKFTFAILFPDELLYLFVVHSSEEFEIHVYKIAYNT